MKQELQEKIFADFPDLYKERHLPMTETCMCWGLAVGDGWAPLLWDLSKELTEKHPEVVAQQVKIKWHHLTYYHSSMKQEVMGIVSRYEKLAAVTCEDCGGSKERTGTSLGVRSKCPSCVIARAVERAYRIAALTNQEVSI